MFIYLRGRPSVMAYVLVTEHGARRIEDDRFSWGEHGIWAEIDGKRHFWPYVRIIKLYEVEADGNQDSGAGRGEEERVKP